MSDNDNFSTCPPSLSLLVSAFRLFGVSSAGVDPRHPHRILRWWILCSATYITASIVTLAVLFTRQNGNTINEEEDPSNFSRPKVVLVAVIGMVLVLRTTENVTNLIRFSLHPVAGRLVRQLSSPTVAGADQDRKLACTILGVFSCYIVLEFSTTVLVSWKWFHLPAHELASLMFHLVLAQLMHSGVYFQVAIFVYAATIYQRQLHGLITRRPHLTIAGLVRIKRQIAALQVHYQGTTRMLQFPILLALVSLTWTLIGCVCSAVTSGHLRELSFTCNIIVNCALRLGVLAVYSKRVPLEYDHLLWHLRHRTLDHWSSYHWLVWKQLHLLLPRFHFTLYRVLTLGQSILVSIGTITLNYLILLIQTSQDRAKSTS